MELEITKILRITEKELLEMKTLAFYRKYIRPEIKRVGADNFSETEIGKAVKNDRKNLKELRRKIYSKHGGKVYNSENYDEYKKAKKLLKFLEF